MKVSEENSRIRLWIRIHESKARISPGFVPKCHGSATLTTSIINQLISNLSPGHLGCQRTRESSIGTGSTATDIRKVRKRICGSGFRSFLELFGMAGYRGCTFLTYAAISGSFSSVLYYKKGHIRRFLYTTGTDFLSLTLLQPFL